MVLLVSLLEIFDYLGQDLSRSQSEISRVSGSIRSSASRKKRYFPTAARAPSQEIRKEREIYICIYTNTGPMGLLWDATAIQKPRAVPVLRAVGSFMFTSCFRTRMRGSRCFTSSSIACASVELLASSTMMTSKFWKLCRMIDCNVSPSVS